MSTEKSWEETMADFFKSGNLTIGLDVAKEPEKMVYIVAEKYFQAQDYARRKGLRPHDWKYVGREDRFVGVKNIKIIVLAGWRRHTDYRQIHEALDRLVIQKRAELEFVEEW